MKLLRIANSELQAIVDDEQYPLASVLNWCLANSGHVKQSKYNGPLLHVFLFGRAPEGLDWDHINRNKLDNRRENLRFATRSQNLANGPKHKDGLNPFKGICFDKSRNKWISKVCVNYKQINLGRFNTAEEAALAYDRAAKEHFGEFAATNF